MKKKKVLFIIWSFSYGGGAEKILANIVNNLDYEKYDIDVLEYLHADKNGTRKWQYQNFASDCRHYATGYVFKNIQ